MSDHIPGPYHVGLPGGPAGKAYSLVNNKGNVVAFVFGNDVTAKLLATSEQFVQACYGEGDGTEIHPHPIQYLETLLWECREFYLGEHTDDSEGFAETLRVCEHLLSQLKAALGRLR